MKLLFLLLLALPIFAQLPGNIADIKGMSKVYVIAGRDDKKVILKAIAKAGFVPVDKDAEYYLSYKILFQDHVTALELPVETGQLDAYIYRDKQQVIVWSDTTGGSWPAKTLIQRFLQANKSLADPHH